MTLFYCMLLFCFFFFLEEEGENSVLATFDRCALDYICFAEKMFGKSFADDWRNKPDVLKNLHRFALQIFQCYVYCWINKVYNNFFIIRRTLTELLLFNLNFLENEKNYQSLQSWSWRSIESYYFHLQLLKLYSKAELI